MFKIEKLSLSGFKTIKKVNELKFDDVNIFIGANGSGKSNIVSFFEMISFMMTEALDNYIINNGFASSILYYGQKVTREIEANISFSSSSGKSDYSFRLAHTANDRFLIMEESIGYLKEGSQKPFRKYLGDGGYKESKLKEVAYNDKTANYIRNFLSNIRVFHFHDTSKTTYIHQARPVESNSYLMSDGGNLAPFLYKLKMNYPKYYDRILEYIRIIAPFFDDFILTPIGNSIILNYKEKNSDLELNSSKLSDGTLRFICLATLLLQPNDSMPNIIIIDEPELGLHPLAIDILSEMINIASKNAQIFITTQSERLLNHFEPKSIIVINRKKDEFGRYCSEFKKLDKEELSIWLEDYALSDMWDSNIIGGRP